MMRYLVFVFLIGLLACAGSEQTPKRVSQPTEDTSKQQKQKPNVSPPKQSLPKVQLDKAEAIIASINTEEVDNIDASKIYKMRCASCHGLKGNMNVNGAKDLTASTISLQESVAQIYFGKGLMLPHKSMLSEAEIVAVAKYVEDQFR